jgi:hypothetical protein
MLIVARTRLEEQVGALHCLNRMSINNKHLGYTNSHLKLFIAYLRNIQNTLLKWSSSWEVTIKHGGVR